MEIDQQTFAGKNRSIVLVVSDRDLTRNASELSPTRKAQPAALSIFILNARIAETENKFNCARTLFLLMCPIY